MIVERLVSTSAMSVIIQERSHDFHKIPQKLLTAVICSSLLIFQFSVKIAAENMAVEK